MSQFLTCFPLVTIFKTTTEKTSNSNSDYSWNSVIITFLVRLSYVDFLTRLILPHVLNFLWPIQNGLLSYLSTSLQKTKPLYRQCFNNTLCTVYNEECKVTDPDQCPGLVRPVSKELMRYETHLYSPKINRRPIGIVPKNLNRRGTLKNP